MGYVLFRSAQAATRAEVVLRREGLAVRLVPTPRQLSSECGTALQFEATSGLAREVETRLREYGVPFTSIQLLSEYEPRNQKGGHDGP